MHLSFRNVAIVAFLLITAGARGQIVTFGFSGAAGNEATFNADAQPANATVSAMSRGSGIGTNTTAGWFVASAWTTSTSLDANDYFEFTITPSSGYQLSLTSLTLDERRSLTGIRSWAVRSSSNNFGSDLGNFSVPDNDLTRTGQSTSLNSLTDITTALTFRIYGYSSEAGGGTWRIDNVTLNGSISAIPEPSTYAVIFGIVALAGAIIQRRRSKGRLSQAA